MNGSKIVIDKDAIERKISEILKRQYEFINESKGRIPEIVYLDAYTFKQIEIYEKYVMDDFYEYHEKNYDRKHRGQVKQFLFGMEIRVLPIRKEMIMFGFEDNDETFRYVLSNNEVWR